MNSGDEGLARFAVTLQRVVDWITAESRTAQMTVRLFAKRLEDDTVVVHNADTGISSNPQNNVVVALYECADNMIDAFTALEELSDEDMDTIDWGRAALYWAENFPYGDNDV